MEPYLKMVSSDYVGEVPASEILPGDLIPEGLVVSTTRDDSKVVVETLIDLLTFPPVAKVTRFARLTKVAFEDFLTRSGR